MKNREPCGGPEKSWQCAPETVMPLNNREQCNTSKNFAEVRKRSPWKSLSGMATLKRLTGKGFPRQKWCLLKNRIHVVQCPRKNQGYSICGLWKVRRYVGGPWKSAASVIYILLQSYAPGTSLDCDAQKTVLYPEPGTRMTDIVHSTCECAIKNLEKCSASKKNHAIPNEGGRKHLVQYKGISLCCPWVVTYMGGRGGYHVMPLIPQERVANQSVSLIHFLALQ